MPRGEQAVGLVSRIENLETRIQLSPITDSQESQHWGLMSSHQPGPWGDSTDVIEELRINPWQIKKEGEISFPANHVLKQPTLLSILDFGIKLIQIWILRIYEDIPTKTDLNMRFIRGKAHIDIVSHQQLRIILVIR
jgi:hypothetical protein